MLGLHEVLPGEAKAIVVGVRFSNPPYKNVPKDQDVEDIIRIRGVRLDYRSDVRRFSTELGPEIAIRRRNLHNDRPTRNA